MNFYLSVKNCKYISWNHFRAPNIGWHTLAQLCARVAPMSHGGHKNEARLMMELFLQIISANQLWHRLESVWLQIRIIKFYEERNVTSWCRFTYENISPLFMCNIQEGAKKLPPPTNITLLLCLVTMWLFDRMFDAVSILSFTVAGLCFMLAGEM